MFSLHTLLLIVERFEGNYFFFGCFVVGLPLKRNWKGYRETET